MPDPNLSSAQVLPGFYGYLNFDTAGGAQTPSRSALIFSIMAAGALALPNVPVMPQGQRDANDLFGAASDASRAYAASQSQPDSIGATTYVLPVAAPSGGVASTYPLKVYLAGANPTKPGSLQLWICSRAVNPIGFTQADTATTIAAALAAAINATAYLPVTATAALGVVTLTYNHNGVTGEDLPVRCSIGPNGTGVKLSPGQALFANAATGAGSALVQFGALSVSTPIASALTAAQVATSVAAAFNSNAYPLTAAVDGTTAAQVNFFFANGQDVRRLNGSVITSTGLTVNLGSGATDGTGSQTSTSQNGVQGVGVPDLTAAISNLDNQPAYRSWCAPWLDATTVGELATSIESSSNGSMTGQKMQTLTLCSPYALTVAGALAPACSPNLTTTAPHYAMLWSPDCAVQGIELAARVAVARSSKWLDTPQFNWNAFQIVGSAAAPILLAPTVPSLVAQNSALFTYALAPLIKGKSGNLEIVKGRTTSLATSRELWSWSYEAQASANNVDLLANLASLFTGTNLVAYSTPKTANVVDINSVKRAIQDRLYYWERLGRYDGADALKSFVTASIDPLNPTRVNADYPLSLVRDLDQIVTTGNAMRPSTVTAQA